MSNRTQFSLMDVANEDEGGRCKYFGMKMRIDVLAASKHYCLLKTVVSWCLKLFGERVDLFGCMSNSLCLSVLVRDVCMYVRVCMSVLCISVCIERW